MTAERGAVSLVVHTDPEEDEEVQEPEPGASGWQPQGCHPGGLERMSEAPETLRWAPGSTPLQVARRGESPGGDSLQPAHSSGPASGSGWAVVITSLEDEARVSRFGDGEAPGTLGAERTGPEGHRCEKRKESKPEYRGQNHGDCSCHDLTNMVAEL